MENAGRILLMPKGDYSASTTYAMLDMVNHSGASWVCKQACTGQAPSDSNTTYWQRFGTAVDMSNYLPKTGGDINGRIGFVDLDGVGLLQIFEYLGKTHLRNFTDKAQTAKFTELRIDNGKAYLGVDNNDGVGTVSKEILHTGNRLEFIGTVSGIENLLTFDNVTYKELYCELAYFGAAKVTFDIVPNGGNYYSGLKTPAGTLGGSVNVRDNTIKTTSFYYEDVSRTDDNVTLSVWGKR